MRHWAVYWIGAIQIINIIIIIIIIIVLLQKLVRFSLHSQRQDQTYIVLYQLHTSPELNQTTTPIINYNIKWIKIHRTVQKKHKNGDIVTMRTFTTFGHSLNSVTITSGWAFFFSVFTIIISASVFVDKR